MSKVIFTIRFFVAIGICLGLLGCHKADDEKVDCAKLGKSFFSDIDLVLRDFGTFDNDKKYLVYICGNQTVHPPIIELATLMANEGPKIVPYLLKKLDETSSDATVRNILRIFTEMQRNSSYNVARDNKLMQALDERVKTISDEGRRQDAVGVLTKIRAQK